MRLIGMAGTARAGKDSAAKFIAGNELQHLQIIDRFDIDDEGELLVNVSEYKEDEQVVIEAGMAKIDLTCKDPVFVQYMAENIWPHVKLFSFADILKFIAIHMYGLEIKQVYGSTKDKMSDTQYTYRTLKKVVPNEYFPKRLNDLDEKVKARRFLQYLADTLRAVNDECFIVPTLKQVQQEQVPLSIITDVRRIKEVEAIQKLGGKVIFFTRDTEKEVHRVEREFDGLENPHEVFDFVVDNQNMSIREKNVEIFNHLHSIEWL